MATNVQSSLGTTGTGVVYVNPSTSIIQTANSPTAPNYTLSTQSSGVPKFVAPPTNIILNNKFVATQGVCFPSAGSAPLSATTPSLTSSTIAYNASAAISYTFTFPAPVYNLSTLYFYFSVPVFALGTTPSAGVQSIVPMSILCAYTSTSASAPVASKIVGATGADYAGTAVLDFTLSASSFPSGGTISFCSFFNGAFSGTGFQLVVNGAITNGASGTTVAVPQSTIYGAYQEIAPSSTYNP